MKLTGLLCAAALYGLGVGTAAGDDFVDEVNALYSDIRESSRSDLIILPVLAEMEPPPPAVAEPTAAFLLPADSADWPSVSAWAEGPTQQAVLQALQDVTREEDPRRAMAFGQPYGAEGIPINLIRHQLYTELGDPPLLSAARHLYLPRLDQVNCLVHVEATRLAADGRVADAIDVLINWAYFCRQMADREFFAEVRWAIERTTMAMTRIRDIAYADFRFNLDNQHALSPEETIRFVHRLREDDSSGEGYMEVDRLGFPQGDLIAARQAVGVVFHRGGGINTDTFATTMASLASGERPLRLFSEAARWDAVASVHAGWNDVDDELPIVFNDWALRWDIPYWDQRMDTPFAYSKLNRSRYAVIAVLLKDMSVLFEARQVLRVESVGTRQALATLGYFYAYRNFPRTLASTRPRFIPALEADPFNSSGRDLDRVPELQYFVPWGPGYRELGPREVKKPHEMNLVTGDGINFDIRIDEDQFVLYSVGPDGIKDWARNVQNTAAYAADADYLLWPPLPSLRRQYMVEQGLIR